jgi:hypothetical protein
MRRWRTWLVVTLAVWIVVVAWWATRPVTDAVPTGTVANVETSQTVQCDSPLSGNTTATAPLPELSHRRAYERTPCALPIHNDRMILWVDIALVFIAAVILVKTWKAGTTAPEADEFVAV